MRKTAWITGMVLVLGTTAWAWAGADGARGQRRAGLDEKLGLSAEQAEQWQALRVQQRAAGAQRRAETRKAYAELRDLLNAPTLDEGAVRASAQRLSGLRAAAVQAQVEARLALRKLLTPEQVEKMKAMAGERRERRLQRREQRRLQRRGGGEAAAEDGPEH